MLASGLLEQNEKITNDVKIEIIFFIFIIYLLFLGYQNPTNPAYLVVKPLLTKI